MVAGGTGAEALEANAADPLADVVSTRSPRTYPSASVDGRL